MDIESENLEITSEETGNSEGLETATPTKAEPEKQLQKYQVQLNEAGYYTGNFAEVGSLPDSVAVSELPNETDTLRLKSYKYKDGKLVFNEEHYNSLLEAQEAEKKKQEIKEQIKQLQSDITDIDAKITECANYKLLELELPYNPKELLAEKTDKQNQTTELETQLES